MKKWWCYFAMQRNHIGHKKNNHHPLGILSAQSFARAKTPEISNMSPNNFVWEDVKSTPAWGKIRKKWQGHWIQWQHVSLNIFKTKNLGIMSSAFLAHRFFLKCICFKIGCNNNNEGAHYGWTNSAGRVHGEGSSGREVREVQSGQGRVGMGGCWPRGGEVRDQEPPLYLSGWPNWTVRICLWNRTKKKGPRTVFFLRPRKGGVGLPSGRSL